MPMTPEQQAAALAAYYGPAPVGPPDPLMSMSVAEPQAVPVDAAMSSWNGQQPEDPMVSTAQRWSVGLDDLAPQQSAPPSTYVPPPPDEPAATTDQPPVQEQGSPRRAAGQSAGGGDFWGQQLKQTDGELADAERGASEASLDKDIARESAAMAAEDYDETLATSNAARDAEMRAHSARLEVAESEARLKERQDRNAIERAAAERKEMQDDINRFEIRDRRTIGDRIGGAVAVALNGIGNAILMKGGVNAGDNVALQIVQRNIERDLEMQRLMLQKKQIALAAKDTELGRSVQLYGMGREADQAARVMLQNKYALALDRHAAGVQNAQARLEAQKLASSLRERTAVESEQFFGQRVEKLREKADAVAVRQHVERVNRANAAAGAAQRAQDRELALAERVAKLRAANAEAALKEREAGSGGAGASPVQGWSTTSGYDTKAAPVVREKIALAAAIKADLAKLDAIRTRSKGGVLVDSGDEASGAIILSSIGDKLSQLSGGGQAGEDAKRRLEDLLGNPAQRHYTRDPSAAYNELSKHIDDVTDASMQAYGLVREGSSSTAAGLGLTRQVDK